MAEVTVPQSRLRSYDHFLSGEEKIYLLQNSESVNSLTKTVYAGEGDFVVVYETLFPFI